MTEDELQALKDLPAPEPREAARAAALAAALAAFDAAGKNEDSPAQGNAAAGRLTFASTQTQRRRLMRANYLNYKIAASVAVLIVAVPMALYMMRQERPPVLRLAHQSEPAATGQNLPAATPPFYADARPAKEVPGNPGGKQFPNDEKSIYERLRPEGATQTASASTPAAPPVSPPPPLLGGSLEDRIDEALKKVHRPGDAPSAGQATVVQGETYRPDGTRVQPVITPTITNPRGGLPYPFGNAPASTAAAPAQSRFTTAMAAPQAAPAKDGAIRAAARPAPAAAESAGAPAPATASGFSVALKSAPDEKTIQKDLPALGDKYKPVLGDVRLTTQIADLGAKGVTYRAVTAPLATKQEAVDLCQKIKGVGGDKACFVTNADYSNSAPGVSEQPVPAEENRDQFEAFVPNSVKQVAVEPVSTFSIDVDTASYSFVRRSLLAGRMPPKDAVRVEEMINYFPYAYPRPESAAVPFQPTVTVTSSPWKPTNKLVHIGIKGYEIAAKERPRANLVLLIDVSGSMAPEDRLPLLKNALRMLLGELKPDDTVGIVTYASQSGVALEPTRVAERGKIINVLERLIALGSTDGGTGLQDAYRLAEMHFDKNAVNRIILATDGDFNVGITDHEQLKRFIEAKRQTGIYLSVIGVGHDNYNDRLMQALAQNGNGVAAYVDTLSEARKVLVDEASSSLFPIAKDVKIQIEFNPARVAEYRLIGYETRALKREDFNNDKVDAGDIGSGHTVTAIYEITPVGAPKFVDDLRYQKPEAQPASPSGAGGELGFLKIRYKLPAEETSKLITAPIAGGSERPDIQAAPEDVRFSIAVAAFGQLLRGEPYTGGFGFDDVIALAQTARGADLFGYRAEFLNLVRLAKSARQ
jgi:Ca-activated chloride channel family protein